MAEGRRVRVVVRPRPVVGIGIDGARACSESAEAADGIEARGTVQVAPGEGKVRVSLRRDARHANGKSDPGEEQWAFGFDHVLPQDCKQEDVFRTCVREMVDDALEGFNGTVLAYGQTGAGKTHTMTGKPHSVKERGLAARTLSYLFRRIDDRQGDSSFSVRLSYLEIYNEQLFDLLHGDPDEKQRHPAAKDDRVAKQLLSGSMQIMTTGPGGGVVMSGLNRRMVRTEEEAFACLFEAETNRVIASHELNYSSTRSHCIFTVYIEGRHQAYDESVGATVETVSHAKLHLVDLAGSERIFKTNSTGTVLQEARAINKSLSFLEQVVVALADKQREHIPYRQSQLTHFLKDSLGGNCKSLLIACIWPVASHIEQTLATLKFATRMLRVKNAPTRNDRSGADSVVLQQYKREVQQLRAELALRDTIFRMDNPEKPIPPLAQVHMPFSKEHLAAIRSELETFVHTGELKHVKAQSARHMYLMFSIMREMVLATTERRGQVRHPSEAQWSPQSRQSVPRPPKRAPTGRPEVDAELEVPSPRVSRVRVASRASQPSSAANRAESRNCEEHLEKNVSVHIPSNRINDRVEAHRSGQKSSLAEEDARCEGSINSQTPTGLKADDNHSETAREAKFAFFRTQVKSGSQATANVNEAKRTLVSLKARSKRIKAQINDHKRSIDACIESLQEAPRDEELVARLKESKRDYKNAMEQLKEIKSDSAFSTQALQLCRQRLAEEFEQWYASNAGD